MCTAILFQNKDTYFGRNLDLERGYGEQVVITPRNFLFPLRCGAPIRTQYAMIGMAAVAQELPLYFEATNEQGLSMAGLNFPENAVYFLPTAGKANIAPFELIPWILGQCADLSQARQLLQTLQLVNIPFSPKYPVTPLHWMLSDRSGSIVIESLREGLQIRDNPFGVLTNNPPFDYHLTNISHYMALHPGPADNRMSPRIPLRNYSLGMGALGLPGDFSSASRFVRACFMKENSQCAQEERANVHHFFHILNGVAMPKGCVWTPNGFEYTRYSSCCNIDRGIYYYTTYDDLSIHAVELQEADLNRDSLLSYPLLPDSRPQQKEKHRVSY